MLNIPYNITYPIHKINTPFKHQIDIIFADDTATGRPCPIIDNIMQKSVTPYYSNTHSNAYCGTLMHTKIERAKNTIRKYYNLTQEHSIIFTGNGATGAVNHFVNLINCSLYNKINVFNTIYEHHSNYLPWYELEKKNNNVKINIIPLTENDDLNFDWLINELEKNTDQHILNIVSITACSNVTGLITDIIKLQTKIIKYNNTKLLFDCACIAPYKRINANNIDGLFISGHKFLGGAGTPGILIAKKSFFQKKSPFCPGGGCVIKADKNEVIYNGDLETKESAGTPNIYGIIKLGYIYKMQHKLENIIETNEKFITKYVYNKFSKLCSLYPKMKVIYLNKNITNRLPIVSFSVDDLHFNLVVILLNDLFGIQSRGGISCCGLFGQYMEEKYKIGGWTRITFNWRMLINTIDYILNAVEYILKNGKYFQKFYIYDKKENHWKYDNKKQ